jgi:mannosyltransferase OCH1-like enzyme
MKILLDRLVNTSQFCGAGYINVQMSDMARVALVWRYGGFYSDNDVVALSSISDLSNAIAFEVASTKFHIKFSINYFLLCLYA